MKNGEINCLGNAGRDKTKLRIEVGNRKKKILGEKRIQRDRNKRKVENEEEIEHLTAKRDTKMPIHNLIS